MKVRSTASTLRDVLFWSLALGSTCMTLPASGQSADSDSAFLACARFADRGQRIACLEDALESALAARSTAAQASGAPGSPVVPTSTAPTPAATTTSTPTASTAPLPAASAPAVTVDTPAAAVAGPSLLDRVRTFGRNTDVTTDESGTERLHDSITALEKRNELWIVTLASGQIWRQSVARPLNLRVGDDIEIFQEGIGNGFRLSTSRLSGFIRVERVR